MPSPLGIRSEILRQYRDDLKPRVSVLMTIYNAGTYLRAAIDSLIGQTFLNWELIAIENGSSDDSFEILQSYSDSRIKIFKLEKNIGRTPALRYANDNAKGEFIAVLDADDVAYPDRLFRQVRFMDNNSNVALVGAWADYIDSQGKVIGSFKPPTDPVRLRDCLGWVNPIAHSSVMYRTNVANDLGGYPLDFVWGQDMALFLLIARDYPIVVLDEFLCKIRIQESNMTSDSTYSLIVALERLELFQMASRLIEFSKTGACLNRGAIAFSKIRLGFVDVCSGFRYRGFRRIFSAFVYSSFNLIIFLLYKVSQNRVSTR